MNSQLIHILIVEDNPGDAQLLMELLHPSMLGDGFPEFHLQRAKNLHESISLVNSVDIDLILLDLNLPDSRGIESFTRLEQVCPNIPVIVLTGLEEEKIGLQAVKAGAQDFLAKGHIESQILARSIVFSMERKNLVQKLDEQRKALERSNMRFYTILSNTVDGILIVDQGNFVRFLNPSAIQIFRVKAEDSLGEKLWFEMDSGPRKEMPLNFVNEDPIYLELLMEEIPWEGENAKLISVRDITDRRRAREQLEKRVQERTMELRNLNQSMIYEIVEHKETADQLRFKSKELEEAHRRLQENQSHLIQTEKLASIGQLAAGVAHEINNPMAFVISNLSTLGNYVSSIKTVLKCYEDLTSVVSKAQSVEIQELVREIENMKSQKELNYILSDIDDLLNETQEGTDRVKEIVKNLKSFARIDEGEIREGDINEGIRSALKMVHNEIKYKGEVITNYGDIPLIQCYPGQLNQVFLNILVNAAQALEKGGTITVTTMLEAENIKIVFADTGTGIAPEHIPKLFDPFFTTKEVGKGTGLGLSISHGIIQGHGGKIMVSSKLGEGTVFTIYLPLHGVTFYSESQTTI